MTAQLSTSSDDNPAEGAATHLTFPSLQRPLGHVVALGPYIADILGRPVTVIPPGQGSVVLDEIKVTVAGTGGGAAVDLAKLGWAVASVGAIGEDLIGSFLRTTLESYGVDTSGLVAKPGLKTSATILPIRPNGERPALHMAGATGDLRPTDVHQSLLTHADAILFGAPETMPNMLGQAGLDMLRDAKASGTKIFVDLLRAHGPQTLSLLEPLLPLVDWFMPNDEQLRRITGIDELEAAARVMIEHGVGAVAVTTGGEGALLVEREGAPTSIPSFPTRVVDTTGCGDSFNAGMITGIMAGCVPQDAARLGCACGSLVATGLGSDAGIVDLAGVVDVVRGSQPEAADRIQACLITPR